MASMKSMIHVLLDVSPSMGDPVNPSSPSSPSKLTLAKDMIGHFFLQRIMASKTVEFRLVTMGDVPSNRYESQPIRGHHHLLEVIPMGRVDTSSLKCVDSVTLGTTDSNIIDGMKAGVTNLVEVNKGKAFNRILLLVTDAESPMHNINLLESLSETMNEIKNFALYIAIVGNYDPAGHVGSSTVYKRENIKVLESLAENVQNSRCLQVTNLSDSTLLLSAGLGLSSKPTLSKTTLVLAENVSIPCVYFCPVSTAKLPSLKKRPRLNNNNNNNNILGDDDNSSGLKRDIVYRDPQDEASEIDASLRVKGYRYGSQFVPVTLADEAALKAPFVGPPRIQIIGFISETSVPRHHLLETAMVVMPAAGDTPETYQATRVIASLHLTLQQTQRVALCRVNKRADADPFLGVLQPYTDVEPVVCGLLLHRLPCADDIRDFSFPSLVQFASVHNVKRDSVRSRQVTAMSRLIDAVTLCGEDTCLDKERDTALVSRVLAPCNPTLQRVLCDLRRKLVGHSDSDSSAATHEDTSLSAPKLVPRPIWQEFSAVFPLERVVKRGRKRKQYFSDLNETAASNSSTAAAAVAHDTPAEDTNEPQQQQRDTRATFVAEMHLSSQYGRSEVVQNEVVQEEEEEEEEEMPEFGVASVTPAEDLQQLVRYLTTSKAGQRLSVTEKTAIVKRAMDTMRAIVDNLIRQGASLRAYEQAVSCLSAWRVACLAWQECVAFNAYLDMPLKKVHSRGRHALVWSLLQQAQITQISQKECPSSMISETAALAFLGANSSNSVNNSQTSVLTPPVLRPADLDKDDDF